MSCNEQVGRVHRSLLRRSGHEREDAAEDDYSERARAQPSATQVLSLRGAISVRLQTSAGFHWDLHFLNQDAADFAIACTEWTGRKSKLS